MFRIVDVQGIPCTKGAASAHAALKGLPGEREVKRQRMKFLRALLDTGRFVGPSWARGRCAENGEMYRFDGQHSSLMLAELEDSDIPQGLLIQMATWEFDTMAESADLFNVFNNPRSARTNEDVMGVYKAAVPALDHLSRKFLVNVAHGIHVRETDKWDNGDEGALGPHPPREHGLYFVSPQPVAAAVWLARFQSLKNQAFLNQPVIVAEMIREWEIDPALATTFWTLVFTEEVLDAAHPARVLAEAYRDAMRKKYQRPPQWKAKAAKAWKAFQQDPTLADPPPQTLFETPRAEPVEPESPTA